VGGTKPPTEERERREMRVEREESEAAASISEGSGEYDESLDAIEKIFSTKSAIQL
jgi:hypothetical protein